MFVEIIRYKVKKKYSLGDCYIKDNDNNILFHCKTLERGWKNNKYRVSCVPTGKYPIIFEYSPKFKQNLWELKKVPNRSECKFHPANFWYELNGCIALGDSITDINSDDFPDVVNSRKTLNKFESILNDKKKYTLIIKNKNKLQNIKDLIFNPLYNNFCKITDWY